MSMLMERRRRTKLSLDPQGKSWSKDNNKIGQKMLEKMGWTRGKGLGANEQGTIEHVRVKKRSSEFEKSGIGYDRKAEEKHLYGCEDIDKFLQQLARYHNQDVHKVERNSEQSLELKSEPSSARLRYKKFIHAKDIKKYNSKDIASIFGKKDFIAENYETEVNNRKDIDVHEEQTIGTMDNWSGIVTINSGSMIDYFEKKLPNYKRNSSANTIDNQTSDSGSETEQRVSFAFAPKTDNIPSTYGLAKDFGEKNNYTFDNPCLRMNSPTEIELNTDNSFVKCPKKRKKESILEKSVDFHKNGLNTEIINSDAKDGFTNPALNLDTEPSQGCNGEEFEVSRVQFGLENCGLDLTDEKSNKKRVTFNDHVEYNVDSAKKKKRKATLDKFEVENKKHKKKRKHEDMTTPISNGFINEALDIEILSEEINDNVLNEHKSKKIKKKKTRKTCNLETIQESPEREKETIQSTIESEVTIINVEHPAKTVDIEIIDEKLVKKKKKKRGKIESITIDDTKDEEKNVEIEEISIDETIKIDKNKETQAATSEIRRKKKKKGKKEIVLETDITIIEKSNNQENNEIGKSNSEKQNDYLAKKKEKNKKHNTFVENSANIETLHLENTIPKKKKKSSNKHDHPKNEFNLYNTEENISDKENAVEKEPDIEILPKKKKKSKRSKDAASVETFPNFSAEVTGENIQGNIESEKHDTPSKKNEISDAINIVTHSPWNEKVKMSKRMLKAFFSKNLIADFPGSNIHEIKGYGVDFDSN